MIGPPNVVGVPADNMDRGRLGDPLGEFRLKFIAELFGDRDTVLGALGNVRVGGETGCPPTIGPIATDKDRMFELDVPLGLIGDIEGAA